MLLAILLSFGLSGCAGNTPTPAAAPASASDRGTLAEAPPPAAIRQLQPALANYQPQVTIVSPADGATLESDRLEVKLQVNDLPIYKDRDFGLGPHLRLYLDNQPPRDLYDLDQPAVFEHLEPGSHTLRAFAVTPWQESFKNAGAYAQTTFNILTATPGTTPIRELPLLTYNSPQGTYGAEPLLLDFYLNNAPLHLVAQEDPNDDLRDWRVRVTVNGESFTLRDWQPVYLTGFQPGMNWVKLELIDDEGLPIANAFNATARLVNYDPSLDDAIAQLTRGDLSAEAARSIVDPNYQPPEPEATEPAAVEPEPATVAPEPSEPEVTESEVTEPEITEPEATEPEVIEPEPAAVAPEPSEPEVTEPEIIEPEVIEPELSAPAADQPKAVPASPAELPAETTAPVEESAPPEPASPVEPAAEAVEGAPEPETASETSLQPAEAVETDRAPALPAKPDRAAEVESGAATATAAVGDRLRSVFQQLRNRFQ